MTRTPLALAVLAAMAAPAPAAEPRGLTIGDGGWRVSASLEPRSFNTITWRP